MATNDAFNEGVVEQRVEEELKVELQKAPDIQRIQFLVKQAKSCRQEFEAYKGQMDAYNEAVGRVQALQRLAKLPKKYPFDTVQAERALEKRVGLMGDGLRAYSESRLQSDLDFINALNHTLSAIARKGYVTIMELRQKVTRQAIVYAIQGIKNTSTVYQRILDEEEFLDLLSVKPQYSSWNKLTTFKGENFYGFNLRVDYEKTTEIAIEIKISRDALYKAISNYAVGPKGKKLRPSYAWEAYTEARRVFGEDVNSVSMEAFDDFMGAWLLKGQEKYMSYAADAPGGKLTSLSSLRFYQGGDVASSSKYIMYQNKSSNTENFEASVSTQAIYNGLLAIEDVFDTGGQVNPTKVKMLFTAYELSDMPRNIVTEAFLIANEYAQENIEQVIDFYNKNL